MTWSYDYGQFFLTDGNEYQDGGSLSKRHFKAGFCLNSDKTELVVLMPGSIGIAELKIYLSNSPKRRYKQVFSSELKITCGQLRISSVDGGYISLPFENDHYAVNFGLVSSKEFGGLYRDDVDLVLTTMS